MKRWEEERDEREFSNPTRSVIRSQVVPCESDAERSARKAASFSLHKSKDVQRRRASGACEGKQAR